MTSTLPAPATTARSSRLSIIRMVQISRTVLLTTDWYMEFQITFVKTGTKIPTTFTSFNATGLIAIDDGNSSLHEYLSFYGLSTSTLENPTAITASTIMSGSTAIGKRFDGATTDYSGIDVTATTAMVTTTYLATSTFTLRTGGKSK